MDDSSTPVAAPPPPESTAPPASPMTEAYVNTQGPVQVHQGAVNAGTVNNINEQTVVHNHLRIASRILEEESISVERLFSCEDAKPLTSNLATELTETFVGDDATTTRLLCHLEEQRVLLITGDRDVGKRTVALYLGLRIARQKKLDAAPLLVDSLERNVVIKLRDIAADAGGFGNRAIVFADAFEQRNDHLRGYFSNANHLDWQELTELLRKNGSYFIFTSTSDSVPFRRESTDRVVRSELQPLKAELIDKAIVKRLDWMMSVESSACERVTLLAQQRTRIIEELRTLSRAVSFLRHFVRDESDFESSLRRFRDASYWFCAELEHDAEAWLFALTLTLAQPARDAGGAPWSDFERMRGALARKILTDRVLFPKRRAAEGGDSLDGTAPGRSLTDDALLERCRAVVTKDSNRLGDIVCFEHPTVTRQLWQTILTRYRRILTLILPVLRAMAEDARNDWSVRVLAAQVIGRIGEIDPARIAIPIVHRWVASGDHTLRRLVGRVVQGSIASDNEQYRSFVLRNIEWLADVKAVGDDEEARDGLLTAIGAYAQIGLYEPSLAMECLGTIVTGHLAPIFENVHQTARDAETVATELSRARSNRAAELHRRRLQLSTFATQLFSEHAPALIAIGQTVSQLCQTHDPVQILRSMRDWTARGGPSSGVLVALLFLRGIASDLQALPAGIRAMTGMSGSRLLPSLAMTRDAVHHFCGFLADVHASINTTFVLPAWLQHDLQDRLAECLTGWARDAITNGDYRQNVQDVFVGLATARRGSVRTDVIAVLESAPFTATESMRTFAGEVRRRLSAGR